MNIGMVGLGKLGMPVAVAMDLRGHTVRGFDISPKNMDKGNYPHQETGPDGVSPFQPLLRNSGVRFCSLQEVVCESELVFVAVQTPHEHRFEGTIRLPPAADRADFEYRYLREAVATIATVCPAPRTLAVISTVLPGTTRRELYPVRGRHRIVYNPFFIAMGTVMRDFLNPEFVLLGADDPDGVQAAANFYSYTLPDAPLMEMSIESAELTKVSYNTFISMKIAFANTVMEMAHAVPGADCDAVIGALSGAKDRLISPAYLRGGMGDGGGCHPRDNIAMSWLCHKKGLSSNLFEDVMRAREQQTEWLADLAVEQADETGLPITLMGMAFKPGTNISTGSPAALLWTILKERVSHRPSLQWQDPHLTGRPWEVWEPAVYVLSCAHPDVFALQFPVGSVVIDPHRRLSPQPAGVAYLPLGRGV